MISENTLGIPEGYRLGRVIGGSCYSNGERHGITFELVPIEGGKWYSFPALGAESETIKFPIEQPKQPKQLEAVIVVDAGPSITAQQDEYKKMLIAQDITEAGYTVRSVTIRERGAIEQGTTPGIAALSSEKQLKSMVNKGCLGCLTDDCDHWNDDTCKEFSGCKLERTICEREKGKNEA